MCLLVCVHDCFSKLDTQVHKYFCLSALFTFWKSDNMPLKSSSDIIDFFWCFQKVRTNQYHRVHNIDLLPAPQIGYGTVLALTDQNSNFMDEIWNYLSWHCVYFAFKHALIGYCVWGTSEVINYHSLSALVKATAAFHRRRAGSFVYREGQK